MRQASRHIACTVNDGGTAPSPPPLGLCGQRTFQGGGRSLQGAPPQLRISLGCMPGNATRCAARASQAKGRYTHSDDASLRSIRRMAARMPGA